VVVGTCELTLQIPENHSLKGKRQVSRSITERIRNRFNVSVAEVDDLDHWQRLSLGVSMVSNEGRHATQVLSKIVAFLEDDTSGAVLYSSRIQILRT
jgi:uncharacterized protein YlxP (DUF503 family)